MLKLMILARVPTSVTEAVNSVSLLNWVASAFARTAVGILDSTTATWKVTPVKPNRAASGNAISGASTNRTPTASSSGFQRTLSDTSDNLIPNSANIQGTDPWERTLIERSSGSGTVIPVIVTIKPAITA